MVIIFHNNTDLTVLYCFSNKCSFGEHKRFHSKHLILLISLTDSADRLVFHVIFHLILFDFISALFKFDNNNKIVMQQFVCVILCTLASLVLSCNQSSTWIPSTSALFEPAELSRWIRAQAHWVKLAVLWVQLMQSGLKTLWQLTDTERRLSAADKQCSRYTHGRWGSLAANHRPQQGSETVTTRWTGHLWSQIKGNFVWSSICGYRHRDKPQARKSVN